MSIAWLPDWSKKTPEPEPANVPVVEPEPADDFVAMMAGDLATILRQKPRPSMWGGVYYRAPWSNILDCDLGPLPTGVS